MGYGYDIMKEYASDGSYSDNPVLDYDKVVEVEEAKGITIISEDRRHYQDLEIFSGTTITELAGKLTRNMDSKATFLGCGKSRIPRPTSTVTRLSKRCAVLCA